jgi:hypothetical protein
MKRPELRAWEDVVLGSYSEPVADRVRRDAESRGHAVELPTVNRIDPLHRLRNDLTPPSLPRRSATSQNFDELRSTNLNRRIRRFYRKSTPE